MAKRSAGLLMYRVRNAQTEVFLVHPGGPFFAKKDLGAWGIPKGEYLADEPALQAAVREFVEETGFTAAGEFFDLGEIRQPSGKLVVAWGFAGDCDPAKLVSNTCQIEWPPRTSRTMEIAEVDRGEWFSLGAARVRIARAQIPFLERLEKLLADGASKA